MLSFFCKCDLDGLIRIYHIGSKKIDKCFGIYPVFGFLDKQGYSLCLAPTDRLLDDLSIL